MTNRNKLSNLALLLLAATMTFVTGCSDDPETKSDKKDDYKPPVVNDKDVEDDDSNIEHGLEIMLDGAGLKEFIDKQVATLDTVKFISPAAKTLKVDGKDASFTIHTLLDKGFKDIVPSESAKNNTDDAIVAICGLKIRDAYTVGASEDAMNLVKGEGMVRKIIDRCSKKGKFLQKTKLTAEMVEWLANNGGGVIKEDQKKASRIVDSKSRKAAQAFLALLDGFDLPEAAK
ncbi:MAG: hypothetical protein AAFP88_02785 [Bacteroidota bacterium]